MFDTLLTLHFALWSRIVFSLSSTENQHLLNATANQDNYSTYEVEKSNQDCEYPHSAFNLLVHSQCPVAHHSFCVIDTPFDILVNLKYRCSIAPRKVNSTVISMNASQLLAQIRKDSELYGGHSHCMLSVFYAPDCAFSFRMLPYVYQLPRMYPRLRVVLTDARDQSKLNSRYGIVATPTVLLWVDGIVVSRMDVAPFSVKAFKTYVEKWTDLESEYVPTVENENSSSEFTMNFHRSSSGWYLWASWFSFILSVTYFFLNSKYGQAFWETIRMNYNEGNEG